MADLPSKEEQDALVVTLMEITGEQAQAAGQRLRDNEWDLQAAADDFYAEQAGEGDDEVETSAAPSGPRTLDGAPVPQPIPTTSSAAPPPQASGGKKKFATLGDISKGGAGGNDPDDDSDDDEDQDLFAGGEKSGLAVQNPDDLRRKLIEKARRAQPRSNDDAAQPRQSHFTGTARTLGGDDTPSQVINQPEAERGPRRPAERVERILHFWSDGFSIDDGPLYNSAEPQNAMMLDMIRRGRAPLSLMNIEHDQEVDVRLQEHDTAYVQPKKKYKPFGGSGQRLGSPTPGVTPQVQASQPVAAPSSSSTETPKHDIDESQPSISLQIRLADGTRLVSRFNTSNTIEDVYNFVSASNNASRTSNWTLMTTFPSKELSDKSAKLEDTSELKKGGVVVQKLA